MGRTVLLASLSINLLGLALPLVVLQVFDRVIPFEAYATLSLLFVGLCITSVLDFLFKWARIVLLGYNGQQYELELGDRFLQKTLGAMPSEYSKTSTGAHFERLGAVTQLRDYFSGQGRLLAVDLPFTAIYVVMIALIGGWLVAVPLVSFALLLVFKSLLQRAQAPIFGKREELDGRRYSFLIEFLTQIVTVKTNAMEPQMLRRYELLQKQSVDISQKLIRFSGFSQSFGALFSQAAVAAMGLFGGYLIIKESIGMAELAACMLLNGRTVQPLLRMLSFWVQSENVAAAQKKINEIACLPQRSENMKFETDLRGHLNFEDVSLVHPISKEKLFSNISFDLKPGEALSILGEAGSGKSSLLRMVLAEQYPDTGKIRLDGRPIHMFAETRGYRGVAYADQNPATFTGTILENISSFGDGQAIKRALDCSERLGLEKAVHRLPMGYNTPIGQGGRVASDLALLQQIALVRALALEPRVLLINDATSAMDDRDVVQLADCLSGLKGETTMLLATRREQLLDLADQSVLLAKDTEDSIQLWVEDAEAEAFDAERLSKRSA